MFLSLLRWKCHLLQRALSHIQPDSVTGFFCKLVSFWLHPTPLALSGSEVFTDLSLHPLRWWWRHVCLISHSWQCPELCRAPGRRQCLLNVRAFLIIRGEEKPFEMPRLPWTGDSNPLAGFLLSEMMLCFWLVVSKQKSQPAWSVSQSDLQTEYFLIYMVDLFEAQSKREWNDDFQVRFHWSQFDKVFQPIGCWDLDVKCHSEVTCKQLDYCYWINHNFSFLNCVTFKFSTPMS